MPPSWVEDALEHCLGKTCLVCSITVGGDSGNCKDDPKNAHADKGCDLRFGAENGDFPVKLSASLAARTRLQNRT